MIRDLLRTRAVVAALAFVAVAGMLSISVASVRAVGMQEQEEESEQDQAERHRYRAAVEQAMKAARHALQSSKEQLHRSLLLAQEGNRGRLRAVQERQRPRLPS